MSKKKGRASNAERADPENDSVYDFLYQDARRVGSFLAQFDYFGHLQQIAVTEAASKKSKRGYNVKLGGSIPLTLPGAIPQVAEGNLSFGREPQIEGSESFARTYDPLWANARAFLDYLEERKIIRRDLTKARMGQFVLVTGELHIVDLESTY